MTMRCGITAAPRKSPTIDPVVTAWTEAGFDTYVHAEPDTVITVPCNREFNDQVLGAYHNWLGAAKRLCRISQPHDWVVIAQDDALPHPDTYMGCELFAEHGSILSLYAPGHCAGRNQVGVIQLTTGKRLTGALAYCIQSWMLEAMLESTLCHNWPVGLCVSVTKASQVRWVDTFVGLWAEANTVPVHTVLPSFVEHIAEHSTLGNGGNRGSRQAPSVLSREQPSPWVSRSVLKGRYTGQVVAGTAKETYAVFDIGCRTIKVHCPNGYRGSSKRLLERCGTTGEWLLV